MPSDASDKGVLRKEMRQLLDTLTSEEKHRASADLVDQLSHLIPQGAVCAIFDATSREPNLSELFQTRSDLTLAYPRVIAPERMAFYHTTCLSSLEPGSFGLHEPDPSFPLINPAELEVIICPGLAFTRDGHRLGQGGGFYDRYLERATGAEIIGVAFQIQILEELPVEAHDFRVGDLLTPRES